SLVHYRSTRFGAPSSSSRLPTMGFPVTPLTADRSYPIGRRQGEERRSTSTARHLPHLRPAAARQWKRCVPLMSLVAVNTGVDDDPTSADGRSSTVLSIR
ncbi:hypothetical protein ACLOJK_024139, partial [Asimina triloba]